MGGGGMGRARARRDDGVSDYSPFDW